MSEFLVFVLVFFLGVVFGWCLSCYFAPRAKVELVCEEHSYSKDNKNE